VATSNSSASGQRPTYSPDGKNYECKFWGLPVGFEILNFNRKLIWSFGKIAARFTLMRVCVCNHLIFANYKKAY
jgi:hypothetical protein